MRKYSLLAIAFLALIAGANNSFATTSPSSCYGEAGLPTGECVDYWYDLTYRSLLIIYVSELIPCRANYDTCVANINARNGGKFDGAEIENLACLQKRRRCEATANMHAAAVRQDDKDRFLRMGLTELIATLQKL